MIVSIDYTKKPINTVSEIIKVWVSNWRNKLGIKNEKKIVNMVYMDSFLLLANVVKKSFILCFD